MARDQMGEAIAVLRQFSVEVVTGSLQEWELLLPDRRIIVRHPRVVAGRLTPPRAAAVKPGEILIVEQADSTALGEWGASDADLVVLDPPSAVVAGTVHRPDAPEDDEPKRGRGRPATSRLALMRALLLATEPLTQQKAASLSGASQQAISKALQALSAYLHHTDEGWAVDRLIPLLAEWEQRYPGPEGITTWWYGLQDVQTQLRDAAKLASDMEAEPLVAGDLAADEYAPWRRPQTAKLYLRHLVDFAEIGLSPAPKDQATLEAVVPADATIWRTAVDRHFGVKIVDPLITLWDLDHSGGSDAAEAAEHLRDFIVSGKLHD